MTAIENTCAAELLERERLLLSAGMQNPYAFREACANAQLSASDLLDPYHRAVFRAVKRCADEVRMPSLETFRELLVQEGEPLPEGDAPDQLEDIHSLEKGLGGVGLDRYAQLVADAKESVSRYRQYMAAAREELLGIEEFPAAKNVPHDFVLRPWSELPDLYNSAEYQEGAVPVPTGFTVLDDPYWLGGFRPGCTYVLAARTGSGKSTFTSNLAMNVAGVYRPTLLFKLEERKIETLWRILASSAQVPLEALINANPTPEEVAKLDQAWAEMRDKPLRISDARDLDGIERTIREHKFCDGELVILDQINLVSVPGAATGYEQVTAASNRLRVLAAELRIPIVAVAQVNRNASKKTEALTLTDLRDSGCLENDAAAVLLLDKSETRNGPTGSYGPMRVVDLIIAKNRYGPVTREKEPLQIRWWPRIQRMGDHREGVA